MPTILRLQHVAITVPADGLERARECYSAVLGLTETPRPPEIQNRPGIWCTFGSAELHIQTRDDVPPPGDRHLALVVDGTDAWRARSAQFGVKMRDQTTIFGRRRLDVYDPFDDRIEPMTEGDR